MLGSLFYLYGLIPNGEQAADLPAFKGIDGTSEVYKLPYGDLAAVVCNLDEAEYGEEALKEKTNQMEWVQEKAFHHHEALMTLRENFTVIPMKFCTIYASRESLEAMIASYENDMKYLLANLRDKEEWNLKIYSDPAQLKEKVEAHNETIEEKRKEIEQMSPGRQYLEKRKLDQVVQQEVEKEKETFCSTLHEKLGSFCEDSTVKKNWNKDVTGKQVEMCWNSAYLVPTDNVEDVLGKITEMKEKFSDAGWQFEATGPWPAYHFANLS